MLEEALFAAGIGYPVMTGVCCANA